MRKKKLLTAFLASVLMLPFVVACDNGEKSRRKSLASLAIGREISPRNSCLWQERRPHLLVFIFIGRAIKGDLENCLIVVPFMAVWSY